MIASGGEKGMMEMEPQLRRNNMSCVHLHDVIVRIHIIPRRPPPPPPCLRKRGGTVLSTTHSLH